ncbi:MAG TPA: hypothetical protein VGR78_00825 [Verrucomicrobiae bacterium]|nr:hypothetical protein [Verrucomicrobiae bacterium]
MAGISERLANQISAQLMPLLSPKYVALLAKRFVIQSTELGITASGPGRVLYPHIDYSQPPPPPALTETEKLWASERLRIEHKSS